MNDLSAFAIGQIKHHVQLDEKGWIASEGVICRLADQEFLYTAGSGDWLLWQAGRGDWDIEVEDISPERFIFGVQGPNSIQILELACGESLRELAFNHSEEFTMDGSRVRVLRTGISGELGYEIHGSAEDANTVWAAIAAIGDSFDLKLLGLRSQPVQHIEAGIATNGLDYLPSAVITPGAPRQFKRGGITGSFVPTGVTDFFRRPDELGWGLRTPAADREFLGREALLAARSAPQRVLVGLRWDSNAVIQILASPLGAGALIEQMDIPRRPGPAFDRVVVDDVEVGVSTGRALSIHLRAMISLCVIDQDQATPGTEVSVIWGQPDSAQLSIPATVTTLPFKPDNRRVDVSTLP
jgi:glycine cleavage system aminomethyltransferase T